MSIMDWFEKNKLLNIELTTKTEFYNEDYPKDVLMDVSANETELTPVTKQVTKTINGKVITRPVTVWVDKQELEDMGGK